MDEKSVGVANLKRRFLQVEDGVAEHLRSRLFSEAPGANSLLRGLAQLKALVFGMFGQVLGGLELKHFQVLQSRLRECCQPHQL